MQQRQHNYDGSLQTDGGLSVAKSAVIGDDLDLIYAAVFKIGNDQPFTLTHSNSIIQLWQPLIIDLPSEMQMNI